VTPSRGPWRLLSRLKRKVWAFPFWIAQTHPAAARRIPWERTPELPLRSYCSSAILTCRQRDGSMTIFHLHHCRLVRGCDGPFWTGRLWGTFPGIRRAAAGCPARIDRERTPTFSFQAREQPPRAAAGCTSTSIQNNRDGEVERVSLAGGGASTRGDIVLGRLCCAAGPCWKSFLRRTKDDHLSAARAPAPPLPQRSPIADLPALR